MKLHPDLAAKCLALANESPTLPAEISERDFQAEVLRLAKRHGWLSYHTHDSRRSAKGFPDLVMVRPPQLLFAELKTNTGKLTPEQQDWLDHLNASGAVACVWRPKDWPMIERALSATIK